MSAEPLRDRRSDPESGYARGGPERRAVRVCSTRASDRFAAWTELPMLAMSVVFLAVLVIPVVEDGLSPGWTRALRFADLAVWAVFAADYLIRLVLAPRRWSFVVRNIPDLLVILLPVLRLTRLLRFVRAGALVVRSAEHARSRLHVRVGSQATITAGLVLFVGAVGMLDAERHAPGSNIQTFGDAVWWAMTTVTTVGYGDKYPITTTGRIIASGVMLTGIAVGGVVTASIATWFVENLEAIRQTDTEQAAQERHVQAALAETLERLASLENQLASRPMSAPDGNHAPDREVRASRLVADPDGGITPGRTGPGP